MQGIKLTTQDIQAIKEKRKTMFRLPIKKNIEMPSAECAYFETFVNGNKLGDYFSHEERINDLIKKFSKYQIGETVYVQEEFEEVEGRVFYGTDDCYGFNFKQNSKPASEMKQDQARIFLKLKGIKAEYLQDISEEDCIKEGAWCDKCENGDVVFWKGDRDEHDSSRACCPKCGRYTDGKTHGRTLFHYDIWNEQQHIAPYDWLGNPPILAYEFEAVEGVER